MIAFPFLYVSADESSAFEDKQIGIKFNYPSSWKFGFAGMNPESCQYLTCGVELFHFDNSSFGTDYGNSGGVRITRVPIESAGCSCSNLDEYVKWIYNILSQDRSFLFFNDNQTFISGHPARLMNYNTSGIVSLNFIYPDSSYTVTEVFTNTQDAFYVFKFFGLGGYSILQSDFDTIMNSVEFLPIEFKEPSNLK